MGFDKPGDRRPADPTAASPGGRVLAGEPIERLREMGRAMGFDVPRRILELYLGDTPLRLKELRRSYAAGDARAMEEAAHSLRGSSANLGAMVVAELCQDLEQRCGRGLPEAAEASLAMLDAEVGKVEQAMRQVLLEFAE